MLTWGFTATQYRISMSKYQNKIRREKRITDGFCKVFGIFEIIATLRKDNHSYLWDKPKPEWKIEDWRVFFKLKINNHTQNE